LTSQSDTPRSCESSLAVPVNFPCISTAVVEMQRRLINGYLLFDNIVSKGNYNYTKGPAQGCARGDSETGGLSKDAFEARRAD
jgi:hypothetical protein